MGTSTPWGTSDHSKQITRGIVQYSTPGHGGIRVAPTLHAKMDPRLRLQPDCDWARVALAFPACFSAEEAVAAESSLRGWFPEVWEAFYGRPLLPGESTARDCAVWREAHRDRMLSEAAWGSGPNVPEGRVGLCAKRASGGVPCARASRVRDPRRRAAVEWSR